MRLAGLLIRNYKRVGPVECVIRIDEIVVLVGPNNSGKSTVLDAYEAFASSGKELDSSHFHNEKTDVPIEITGVFTGVTSEDEETLGKKWKFVDPEYGECLKVRWIWRKPGEKGVKQTFNPEKQQFEDGGAGGWDSLLQSRIPQPIRIRPTDPIDTTQTKIVSMLKEHVKSRLKADSQSTKTAFEELEKLAKKIFEDSKAAFEDVATKITATVSDVFPGTTIELVPRSKDSLDEKVIGADSYLRVGTANAPSTPLALQGTGIQRALLWSALSVMSEGGSKKREKAKGASEVGKILLIDEPEAFLHPPTIRGARESLYDFALGNSDWQVIATTHSPIFIDLSKDHTSIIRVDPESPHQRYVSTDKIAFDGDAKTRLQMVRSCNPIVNEFFFYDNIVLVEGPTEQLAVQHVAACSQQKVHVINCLGKANIPLFARILNQFRVPYLVIHDSDTPNVLKKGVPVKGAMWTVNQSIRNAVLESNDGRIFTQFPHFEGEFLDEELVAGKVDRVIELLADERSTEYKKLHGIYARLLARDDSLMTTKADAFEQKKNKYIGEKKLEADPKWKE